MIDIHCHILPGVDDGAKTITESIAMAKKAESEGIKKIIATPNYPIDFHNPAKEIIDHVATLNAELVREGVQVKILPGQELSLYKEIKKDLISGSLLPLNQTTKFIPLALPSTNIPTEITNIMFELQIEGYIPIILHPERITAFQDNPDKLYRFVKNGALTQITAGSLLGKFGKKVEKLAHQFIESNLTHFIASDAHNTKKRGFYLTDAYQNMKKRYGTEKVYQFMENSEAVLNGSGIIKDMPERVTVKRKWGIF